MVFTSKSEEQLGNLSKVARDISENAEIQSKKLESLSSDVKKLTKRLDREDELYKETKKSILNIDDKVDSVQKSIRKNSVTLEDLLQEWSKLRKQQKKLVKYVAGSCFDSQLETQTRKDLQSLLDLVLAYHEQIAAVLSMLQEDISLKDLAGMNQRLQDARRLSGMDILGQKDEVVREEFHEVMEIIEPATPDSPLVVETVVKQGYLYHGRVLRKALVIARAATEAEATCCSLPQVETDPSFLIPEKKKNRHGKKHQEPDPEALSFYTELLASLEDAEATPSSMESLLDQEEEVPVSDIYQAIEQESTDTVEAAVDEHLLHTELLTSTKADEESSSLGTSLEEV